MKKYNLGLTFTELVMVIAVIGILAVMAIPSYVQLQKSMESKWFHQDFISAYHAAKSAVILYHKPVVICGSSDIDHLCDHNWNKGLAVFIDANNNSQHDVTEKVLSYTPANIRFGVLKLKISLNKRIVKLSMERGLVFGYMGKFIYCQEDLTLMRALIWGSMGNMRFAQDSNGDGIRDNNGEALDCS